MPSQAPNICCRDDANLEKPIQPHADKPELTYQVCTVCGSRHFRLRAEPGQIGMQGGQLGRTPDHV